MTTREPKVFISYRRQHTAPHAGRLYDAMAARFGGDNVFMDLDLAPGIDFVDRITDAVGACRVLLVVMGPEWATVRDDEGQVRIADPEDFIRLEVETALRRPDVTVVPVLVGGASMPAREDLPEEIRALSRRNAMELSEGRWRYDVDRLGGALDEILEGMARGNGEAPPAEPEVTRLSTSRLIVEGVLVAAVAALVARAVADPVLEIGEPREDARRIANVIQLRAETWGVVGAALAAWLAVRTARARHLRLPLTGLLIGVVAGALGGAIYALPVFLVQADELTFEEAIATDMAQWINVGAFAATGGLIGALIGGLWRPRRLAAGFAAGAAAAALTELVLRSAESQELVFAASGAAIAAGTLAVLAPLAGDRAAAGATQTRTSPKA